MPTINRFNDLRLIAVISTWGGDHTSADILVKHDAIENVTRVFKRENIAYDVVIEDLQKRIDEENPPLTPEEMELHDRRGMTFFYINHYHQCVTSIFSISVLIKFSITISSIIIIGLPLTVSTLVNPIATITPASTCACINNIRRVHVILLQQELTIFGVTGLPIAE